MDRLRAAISDLAGRTDVRRWDPRALRGRLGASAAAPLRRPTALLMAVVLVLPLAATAFSLTPLLSRAAATTTTVGEYPCAQTVTGTLTGTAVAIGRECVVTFQGGSGDWTVPTVFSDIRYLVVAGGGGGSPSGGGGAGGLLTGTTSLTTGAAVAVAVGAGGTGGAGTFGTQGRDGGNSTLGALVAVGGGGAGANAYAANTPSGTGRPGGSGGGGGAANADLGTFNFGGAGTAGQGFAGGRNSVLLSTPGGGGGGAGGAGGNGTDTGVGGAAGPGLESDITGEAVGYAGGGAGASFSTDAPGASAAAFGGGTGATTGNGGNGTDGRGGGGGGARLNFTGGSGGSGVVIVRFTWSDCPTGLDGAGTAADPCQITSATDLAKVRERLDLHYRQTANIALTGAAALWAPIGHTANGTDPATITPFTGSYDGQGFEISGIQLGTRANTAEYGFFARLEGATVQDLRLTFDNQNNMITRNRSDVPLRVGHLAGTAHDTTISKVRIRHGQFQYLDVLPGTAGAAAQQSLAVGGVVGIASGTTVIEDVSFVGSIRIRDVDRIVNGVSAWAETATFDTPGTFEWTVPAGVDTVDVLVVGGGGGGGSGWDAAPGGGGGAGGLRQQAASVTAGTVVAITVGAGGTGGTGTGGAGGDGAPSSFGALEAVGGGGGGSGRNAGGNGGSGGGAGGRHNLSSSSNFIPTVRSGGTGTEGQGAAGGSSTDEKPGRGVAGGGGGGAGGPGESRVAPEDLEDPDALGPLLQTGGAGGPGVTSDITGTEIVYAVGGDGGAFGVDASLAGVDASAVGSGGGGGEHQTATTGDIAGGAGSAGIVVVRWDPTFHDVGGLVGRMTDTAVVRRSYVNLPGQMDLTGSTPAAPTGVLNGGLAVGSIHTTGVVTALSEVYTSGFVSKSAGLPDGAVSRGSIGRVGSPDARVVESYQAGFEIPVAGTAPTGWAANTAPNSYRRVNPSLMQGTAASTNMTGTDGRWDFAANWSTQTGTAFPVLTWETIPAGTVAPGAPGTPVATLAGTIAPATVTWTAPEQFGTPDNSPTPLTYTVTASPAITGGGTCSNATATLSCDIEDLRPGITYTFTVTATNAVGTGPASVASNGVTPARAETITIGVPALPTPAPVLTTGSLVLHLDAASYPGSGTAWPGLNGTTGVTLPADTAAPTFNAAGGYFDFDGTNDQVTVGSRLTANSSYTIDAWVFDRGAGNTARNILTASGASQTVFYIEGSKLRAGLTGDFALVEQPDTFPASSTPTWRHVAVSFQDGGGTASGTMVLYIDGLEVDRRTGITERVAATDFVLGAYNNGNRWNGGIAQARMYSTALSDTQILANFNATSPRFRGREFPVTLSSFDDTKSYQVFASIPDGRGALSLGTTTGLAAVYGYDDTTFQRSAGRELGFSGAYADVVAALATLRFTPVSDNANPATELTVTVNEAPGGPNAANVFYFPDNGHYYEYVNSGAPIAWTAARDAAAARTLFGRTGYLATVTSLDESTFVSTQIDAPDIWIGATDAFGPINTFVYGTTQYADQAASEGKWYWVTGPQSERVQFWSGAANGSAVDGRFEAWAANEPNNATGSAEHYAGANYRCSGGACDPNNNWNDFMDLVTGAGAVTAYLVEYGGLGEGLDAASVTATKFIVSGAPGSLIPSTIGEEGDRQVVLTWEAPLSGGALITGYQYSLDNGATWSPADVTALTATTVTLSTIESTTDPDGLGPVVDRLCEGGVLAGIQVRAFIGAQPSAFAPATRGPDCDAAPTLTIARPSLVGGNVFAVPVTPQRFDTSVSYSAFVTVPAGTGTLSLGVTAGLSPIFDHDGTTLLRNGSDGTALGFFGTYSNVAAALASVRFSPATGNPRTELTVTLTERPATANAANVYYNPDNGHYYEFVAGSFAWSTARATAASRSLFGMTGYLATITSLEESTFLARSITAPNIWIGAIDMYLDILTPEGTRRYASQTAAEGRWHWVTGPEAGQQFWEPVSGNQRRQSTGGGRPVDGRFSAWTLDKEPNNAGGVEHGAGANFACVPNCDPSSNWNDFDRGTRLNFVVEYGGMPGETSTAVSATATAHVVTSAPNRLTAAPADGGIELRWDAPTFGAGRVSFYEYSLDGGSTWAPTGTRRRRRRRARRSPTSPHRTRSPRPCARGPRSRRSSCGRSPVTPASRRWRSARTAVAHAPSRAC
jgi:hypothetical protein